VGKEDGTLGGGGKRPGKNVERHRQDEDFPKKNGLSREKGQKLKEAKEGQQAARKGGETKNVDKNPDEQQRGKKKPPVDEAVSNKATREKMKGIKKGEKKKRAKEQNGVDRSAEGSAKKPHVARTDTKTNLTEGGLQGGRGGINTTPPG